MVRVQFDGTFQRLTGSPANARRQGPPIRQPHLAQLAHLPPAPRPCFPCALPWTIPAMPFDIFSPRVHADKLTDALGAARSSDQFTGPRNDSNHS
jgi:hypothetical protein